MSWFKMGATPTIISLSYNLFISTSYKIKISSANHLRNVGKRTKVECEKSQ